jgi:septal ring factor EnvC (AmiA/AmiB activator)
LTCNILKFLTLLLVTSIAFSANIYANQNSQEIKKTLAELKQTSDDLSSKIYQSKRKEQKLNNQLENLDLTIGKQNENLRITLKQKKKLTSQLNSLYKQKEDLDKQYSQHEKALQLLVHDSYGHFNNERLKMLLNQTNWEFISRLDAYYQIIYNKRIEELNSVKTYLTDIETNRTNIAKKQENLKKIIHNIKLAQKALDKKQQRRKKILANLQKDLNSKELQQQNLKHQEQHLLGILAHLEKQIKQSSGLKNKNILPISKLRGNLNSPLTKLEKFKSISGKMKSFIPAEVGEPVHSIHSGTIIFSQWLRGIGLLLIIDHGEGYLSLYGNNQILYKNVGDLVESQELIARVGESGTSGIPGLYFEIRKDGLALNTLQWLKKG